jgi:hypothetical protein
VAPVANRDFGGVKVSTVDWPIVLVEYPENKLSDQHFEASLGYVEVLMAEAAKKKEKIFVITDLTLIREMSPASQRHYGSNWLKRTAPLANVACVGGANVTPSAILRGILRAVFWVYPPPRPSVLVASRQEAMLLGIRMLQVEKATLPPRLLAYRDSNVVQRTL